MPTILLLLASNIFMTIAWYGHLKHASMPLWKAILVSWGIAFFEYCLMVPANRLGYGKYSPYQLKIIQEVITLLVFIGFALVYFGQAPRWNHIVAFLFIALGVAFGAMPDKSAEAAKSPVAAVGE